ncbi:ALRF2-like protein, partial [Mya arenaria]
MGDKIDMSLDDIIKSNKKPGRGGGRGGRGAGGRGNRGRQSRGAGGGGRGVFRGGVQKRRQGGRGGNRSFGRTPPKGNTDDVWQHDMYDGSGAAAIKRLRSPGGGLQTGSGKLHISNLDFGVSESDIQRWRWARVAAVGVVMVPVVADRDDQTALEVVEVGVVEDGVADEEDVAGVVTVNLSLQRNLMLNAGNLRDEGIVG